LMMLGILLLVDFSLGPGLGFQGCLRLAGAFHFLPQSRSLFFFPLYLLPSNLIILPGGFSLPRRGPPFFRLPLPSFIPEIARKVRPLLIFFPCPFFQKISLRGFVYFQVDKCNTAIFFQFFAPFLTNGMAFFYIRVYPLLLRRNFPPRLFPNFPPFYRSHFLGEPLFASPYFLWLAVNPNLPGDFLRQLF